MNHDYNEGDPPVPVGTVVDYFGSLDHGRYEITGHMEPVNVPNVPEDELPKYFPDGVAYELWPEGVERRFGNRNRAAYNVRRTSFRKVNT
jgi:hypothetical protein